MLWQPQGRKQIRVSGIKVQAAQCFFIFTPLLKPIKVRLKWSLCALHFTPYPKFYPHNLFFSPFLCWWYLQGPQMTHPQYLLGGCSDTLACQLNWTAGNYPWSTLVSLKPCCPYTWWLSWLLLYTAYSFCLAFTESQNVRDWKGSLCREHWSVL